MRVRKDKLPENTHLETSEVLADLEKKVWGGVVTDWGSGMPPSQRKVPQCRRYQPQVLLASTKAASCTGGAAQKQYENKVLRPLLGGEHIHQGHYVRLPAEFAATLARMSGLQLTQDAWIAPDHTVFCPGPPQDPGISSLSRLYAWLIALVYPAGMRTGPRSNCIMSFWWP